MVQGLQRIEEDNWNYIKLEMAIFSACSLRSWNETQRESTSVEYLAEKDESLLRRTAFYSVHRLYNVDNIVTAIIFNSYFSTDIIFVHGIGDIDVISTVGIGDIDVISAVYAEELKMFCELCTNLLSRTKIMDMGCKIFSDQNKIGITQENEVIATGKRYEALFRMNLEVKKELSKGLYSQWRMFWR